MYPGLVLREVYDSVQKKGRSILGVSARQQLLLQVFRPMYMASRLRNSVCEDVPWQKNTLDEVWEVQAMCVRSFAWWHWNSYTPICAHHRYHLADNLGNDSCSS